jgi:hypothetical protein
MVLAAELIIIIEDSSTRRKYNELPNVLRSTSILFSELVVVVSEEAWTRIMLPLPEVKLQLWDDPCMLHSPLPELRDLKPCLALLLNCISASAILSYEVPILDKILSICLLLLFTRCLPAVSLFVAL